MKTALFPWAFIGIVTIPGLALLVSGCRESSSSGPERAAVRGKVTVNGAPLSSGEIRFVSLAATAGPSSGSVIAQGEFSISKERGPVVGEYQVQIRAFRGTGQMDLDRTGELENVPADNVPADKKRMVELQEQFIPAQYNDTSELRASIVGRKVNECHFELTLDGGAASAQRKPTDQ